MAAGAIMTGVFLGFATDPDVVVKRSASASRLRSSSMSSSCGCSSRRR
jgi:hypothetical protein